MSTEALFAGWIDAHPAKGEPEGTAVWLRDLADALPARNAGAPGRGPRERRPYSKRRFD